MKMTFRDRVVVAAGALFSDSYARMARKSSVVTQANYGNKNPIGHGTGELQFIRMFRNNAFAKQIVTVPIQDALSKGRTWNGEGVDQAEIDKIVALEKAPHISLHTKLYDALIMARLYGGAAILIGTKDKNLSLPLVPDKIKEGGLLSLTVFSRFEFREVEIDQDLGSPTNGSPKFFHLSMNKKGVADQTKIHPSRLVVFHGDKFPLARGIHSDYEFWGDGVLRSRMVGVTQLDQAYTSLEALLLEAKSPTLAYPHLWKKMQTDEDRAKVMSEAMGFNRIRSATGLNIIDKEMEFKNNSYQFSGIKDTIDHFKSRVAGEADIPEARLYGRSATGLAATGEGDLKNYYDRIKSDQENIISPPMAFLDIVLVRSALGNTKAQITPQWNPLITRTSKERADEFKIYLEGILELHRDSYLDDDRVDALFERLITNSKIGEV